MPTNSSITDVLKAFYGTCTADCRGIFLSTPDGTELLRQCRSAATQPEDSALAGSLIPSFMISADQSLRLNLGIVKHSVSWVPCGIVLQCLVEKVVVTFVLDESCNLGIIEEQLGLLQTILRPVLTDMDI